MQTYSFTLVLRGLDENTPHLEDALYESHCDDALINFRNGTVYLDFDREAGSMEEAIISAIKDIESSSLNPCVAHVAPDDWVSEAEMAKRLSVPRQTVSLWAKRERRSDVSFPNPVMKLAEKSPLWRWSEVAKWLYQNKIIKDVAIVNAALLIENMNAALEERNRETQEWRLKLLKELVA